MNNLQGFFLILLSAASFGAMALCAKIANADGVDTASLLALRFTIAAFVLGISVQVRKSSWPAGQVLRACLLMGAVYATMSWSYFSALDYASSSTVALVFYIYPILATGIAVCLGLDHFGRAEFIAVTGSTVGLLVMIGASLESTQAGFCLALLSAMCYAGYIILGCRINDAANPIATACLIVGSAGVIFLLISTISGFHFPHSARGWTAVLFMASFGTAIAMAAFVAGLGRVGPTLAAVLSTFEPLVTIVLGICFLKESLQSGSFAGGMLILCAAIGLTLVRMKRTARLKTRSFDSQ